MSDSSDDLPSDRSGLVPSARPTAGGENESAIADHRRDVDREGKANAEPSQTETTADGDPSKRPRRRRRRRPPGEGAVAAQPGQLSAGPPRTGDPTRRRRRRHRGAGPERGGADAKPDEAVPAVEGSPASGPAPAPTQALAAAGDDGSIATAPNDDKSRTQFGRRRRRRKIPPATFSSAGTASDGFST